MSPSKEGWREPGWYFQAPLPCHVARTPGSSVPITQASCLQNQANSWDLLVKPSQGVHSGPSSTTPAASGVLSELASLCVLLS